MPPKSNNVTIKIESALMTRLDELDKRLTENVKRLDNMNNTGLKAFLYQHYKTLEGISDTLENLAHKFWQMLDDHGLDITDNNAHHRRSNMIPTTSDGDEISSDAESSPPTQD